MLPKRREAKHWIIRTLTPSLSINPKFKRVDVQASFWNLKPDYECLEMEESISRESN
jgi:hypothetical protein